MLIYLASNIVISVLGFHFKLCTHFSFNVYLKNYAHNSRLELSPSGYMYIMCHTCGLDLLYLKLKRSVGVFVADTSVGVFVVDLFKALTRSYVTHSSRHMGIICNT